MSARLDSLIAALKEELKHYGEMLVLLNGQQHCIIRRASGELLQTVTDLDRKVRFIQSVRREREQLQRAVLLDLQLPPLAAFGELIPRLPAPYQALAQSLLQEINDLLARIRDCARQNHVLLSRSLELLQELFNALYPAREAQAYSERGRRISPTLAPPPMYQAVG